MPGASAFTIPPSEAHFDWPPNNTVLPASQWSRGIPVPTFLAPTGVADCRALERGVPPTLRTAYECYALSIAWGLRMGNAGGWVGNLLVELALLVNDQLAWVGTDSGAGAQTNESGPTPVIIANGIINADLVNPVRINPRERLSLRIGMAVDAPVTPSPGTFITMAATVAEQDVLASGATTVSPVAVQSTISYQIIDLPGARSL